MKYTTYCLRLLLSMIVVWIPGPLSGYSEPAIVGNYPSKKQIASMEIDQIAKAVREYIKRTGSSPSAGNPKLFKVLDGNNPQMTHFLATEYMMKNPRGQIVDPWGDPYKIERSSAGIVVSSERCGCAKRVTFPSK